MLRAIHSLSRIPISSLCKRSVFLVIALCVAPATSFGALSETGRWTPNERWSTSKYAIHLALVRGDGNPAHSHVIWWSGEHANGFNGGDWRWTPGSEGCASWPSSDFVANSTSTSGVNVFCAGNVVMNGQLFVPGGDNPVTYAYGENNARIWTPGTGTNAGTWTNPGTMQDWRWYPTAVGLADSRCLVLSGLHHPFHTFFGGRRDGVLPSSPVGDSLSLFAPLFAGGNGGEWEMGIIPEADPTVTPGRPAIRERHTAVDMEVVANVKAQMYFGGRDASGNARSDAWVLKRDPNYTGATYVYRWEDTKPAQIPQDLARSDHAAVRVFNSGTEGSMIVFGGLDNSNSTLNDAFRLYYSGGAYHWQQLRMSGTIPSARYGHAALYDEMRRNSDKNDSLWKRVIVFGGAGTYDGTPTDPQVYEMRVLSIPDSVVWHAMTEVDLGSTGPGPRLGQAMAIDSQTRGESGKLGHAAFLFGGQLESSTFSDSLWILYLFDDDTYGWKYVSPGGSPPAARTKASLLLSQNQGQAPSGIPIDRLYLWGGEDGTGPVDADQHILDPWATSPAWTEWAASGFAPSGGAGLIDADWSLARTAEVYDPATNSWQLHSSANLFQETYPPSFVVPGGSTAAGRVISMGRDKYAYSLEVSGDGTGDSWSKLDSAYVGFHPEAAVMYRPGQIMVGGGEDSPNASNLTKTLDTSDLNNSWQSAAPSSGSGSLVPRQFHNLVLLPDGKVLAVGGMNTLKQDEFDEPVLRPQIWDPATSVWSDTTLDRQPTHRNYHSTAILLPDGRVLSAGGENSSQKFYANIFCPPCLFDGDDPAVRPALIATTGRWRYNADVTFAVNTDTTIRNVCLIRAPATTHAFDQSQRYVPLTLLSAQDDGNGTREYFLKAPPDSFRAPPGDYLLFVSNSSGVPAIAPWVRVGSVETGQFDTTAPDTLSLAAEFITCNGIYPISWSAPGDDGASGIALDYDIRYSTSPITEVNFQSATQFTGLLIPHLAGSMQSGDDLTSLETCTNYYFAAKTRDRAGNWSSLGRAKYKTLCVGGNCGGGGVAMRRSREEGGTSLASARWPGGSSSLRNIASPSTLTGTGSSLRLVGEFENGESAHWTLHFEDFGDQSNLLEATSAGLVVLESTPGGEWGMRSSLSPHAGIMGVRSLRASGRVVFPAGTTLEALELAPLGFDCVAADDSRLGDLRSASIADLSTEFAVDDTITLSFARSGTGGDGEDCFFEVLIPGDAQVASTHRPGAETPTSPGVSNLPLTFALHPAKPNPFSRATTIRFDLPRASNVRLEIFDVQGRRIATLLDGLQSPGRHSSEWNGVTESGSRARAGVYLCRMTAESFTAERRISLLP